MRYDNTVIYPVKIQGFSALGIRSGREIYTENGRKEQAWNGAREVGQNTKSSKREKRVKRCFHDQREW